MGYDAAAAGTIWVLEGFRAYPGLTVRVRRPGFAAWRMLIRADAVLEDSTGTEVKRLDALNAVFTALADSIDSWTLTRHGRPVPVTRAAVLACDGAMLAAVVAAWRRHVLAPNVTPRPSEPPQQAFDDRLLRNLPMEPLGVELETDVDTEPERGAEEPEDAGVALSLDPDIAAAQKHAWAEADEAAGAALHGGPEVRAVASA